ncbi:MAG: hypothetical protein H6R15_4468 [Proteobacteria bacterium]|nr:hypothetical protein [Pseudomonadota bacterium]
MTRLLLLVLAATLFSAPAVAAPYGNYDIKRIMIVRDTPSGKSYGLDAKYLDEMIGDLSDHAENYPPKFDSPEDRKRAEADAKQLAGFLDAITSGSDPNQNPQLLIRAALVNSMGHILDIKGSAERAEVLFRRTVALVPANPHVNFHYGVFLAGTGRAKDGIPFLEKALSGGYDKAAFSLGMAYLTQGENEKALQYLEAYRKKFPNDPNTAKLIEAIRSGNVTVKRNDG